MLHKEHPPATFDISSRNAPKILLRLTEIALTADDKPRLHAALGQLGQMLHSLNYIEIVKVMKLAARAERPGVVAEAIRHVCARKDFKKEPAVEILNLAHRVGNETLAEAVENRLADLLEPNERRAFLLRAASLRRGPADALEFVRRNPSPARTPFDATELGEVLLAAGKNRLALRYLRRCHRKWPGAPGIRRILLIAYTRNGLEEEARRWLSGLDTGDRCEGLDGLWLTLAMQTGDSQTAFDVLSGQIKKGRRSPGDLTLILVLLSLGRLDEAESTARALRTDPGKPLKQSAHFGVLHVGALINEMRLYKRLREQGGSASPGVEDVKALYFAAKETLDTWEGWPCAPDPGTTSRVPRTIFQYWNTEDIPADVDGIMQSWQAYPEWQYRRFNRRTATEWLKATFGPEHARAFKLANHVAEESDFLRLCLLLAEGGIYADADDRLLADPATLLGYGPGLVLFREPGVGAISNNLLCAPPGHPAMRIAVELTLEALLRRDNDSTWAKTGPGLLTRATAAHVIANRDTALEDFALVPPIFMHRHIQAHVQLPYKSTPKYWNTQSASIDPAIKQALQDLVPSD
mgnify:CR=1 FL=1